MGKMDEMDNMSTGMAGKMRNMTVVMIGDMTGNMKCDMTSNTEKMTGAAGKKNMTGRMENMTVLMAGKVTGTITCDLTKKMVIARNIGNMDEVVSKMCKDMSGRMEENMSGRMEDNTSSMEENTSMENMYGRMEDNTSSMEENASSMEENTSGRMETMNRSCNMTGSMIILKDMDKITGKTEKMDTMTRNEEMDYMNLMDASTVVIEDIDISRMDGKNITRTSRNMDNATGKIVIIRNMDDKTQIVTKTVKCNITENTTTINTENMARKSGRMR
jgi:hypothetical protein